MVTKRQQLKWLAKRFESLPFDGDSILMSDEVLGYLGHEHKITNQELKQERDKMQKKAEQTTQPDNSWYERGELPPVGCECEAMRDGEWVAVEVLRHRVNNVGVNVAAVMDCTSFNVFWAMDFRPLRTEREKAIDEMVSVILDYDGYMITSATAELVARQLHYAGYHK